MQCHLSKMQASMGRPCEQSVRGRCEQSHQDGPCDFPLSQCLLRRPHDLRAWGLFGKHSFLKIEWILPETGVWIRINSVWVIKAIMWDTDVIFVMKHFLHYGETKCSSTLFTHTHLRPTGKNKNYHHICLFFFSFIIIFSCIIYLL